MLIRIKTIQCLEKYYHSDLMVPTVAEGDEEDNPSTGLLEIGNPDRDSTHLTLE